MLFLVLAVAVVAMFLMAKMLGPSIVRIVERLVTGHFKNAEALLERKRLPEEWNATVTRMASRGTIKERLVQGASWQTVAHEYLIRNLQKMRKFFTTCPYVADEETRTVILEDIDEIIERWNALDTTGILALYDVVVDATR